MKVSLLAGVVLLVLGLTTAMMGIFSVGGPVRTVSASTSMAMPFLGGLALAVGGLLIGLSMGNWNHPRSHVEPGDHVVDPEGHHKMKHV